MCRCGLVAALLAGVFATHVGAADSLQLRVLSSHADMVSGGDALVRVEVPAGVAATDVKIGRAHV